MSLLAKLKKNSKIKDVAVLSDSTFFNGKTSTPTDVPMLNVALSGSFDGGVTSGLTVLAGPSKHFKTSFALKIASAYLKAKPEAALLFYDSEFGSPQSYFESFGIDTDRVIHTPIKNVEELKFDIMSQLEGLEREDDVIILIDSLGNLASKKEVDDAIDGKSVADMSRAKQIKSLFRMVTPYLTMSDIPLLCINHTYSEMGLFPKEVMSGGTGVMYSADNVWIIGRRQQKQGTEVIGYDFVINVEKSRFVKEKTKIPITVTWAGGIDRYAGLMDLAMAHGAIKQSGAWYQVLDFETGELQEKKLRANQIDGEFYDKLLEQESFQTFVRKAYKIGAGTKDDEIDLDLEQAS